MVSRLCYESIIDLFPIIYRNNLRNIEKNFLRFYKGLTFFFLSSFHTAQLEFNRSWEFKILKKKIDFQKLLSRKILFIYKINCITHMM